MLWIDYNGIVHAKPIRIPILPPFSISNYIIKLKNPVKRQANFRMLSIRSSRMFGELPETFMTEATLEELLGRVPDVLLDGADAFTCVVELSSGRGSGLPTFPAHINFEP